MDIAAWLRGLGLEQHEAAFRANEVDASLLPRLTNEDLKDLGVTLVGHRRRLLDAIAAIGAEPATVADVSISAASERRQLTVMFCDLVGSTPMSARLDPEDLRGIIGSYQRCVAETVESFGGFVARYMATEYWFTSDIRRHTRTTRNAPYDADWRRSSACRS